MEQHDKRVHAFPIVLTALVALGFLLAVHLYLRIFPDIEAAHPDNYEVNVARALADGDPNRAVKIARQATRARRAAGRAR